MVSHLYAELTIFHSGSVEVVLGPALLFFYSSACTELTEAFLPLVCVLLGICCGTYIFKLYFFLLSYRV
jgi:hypothetical protein